MSATEAMTDCNVIARTAQGRRTHSVIGVVSRLTPQIVKSCTHALAEFTPRQLIEELRARGYKGELQYVNIIKL